MPVWSLFQSPLGAYGHNTLSLLTTLAPGAGVNKLGNYYTCSPCFGLFPAIDRLKAFIFNFTNTHSKAQEKKLNVFIPCGKIMLLRWVHFVWLVHYRLILIVCGQESCINTSSCSTCLKSFGTMRAGTSLPWMRGCQKSPTIVSWHAQKHVLSRCIRIQSSSIPSIPCCLIFHLLYFADSHEKKETTAPHTSNTQQSNGEACGSVGVHVSFLLQAFTGFTSTLA